MDTGYRYNYTSTDYNTFVNQSQEMLSPQLQKMVDSSFVMGDSMFVLVLVGMGIMLFFRMGGIPDIDFNRFKRNKKIKTKQLSLHQKFMLKLGLAKLKE